MNLLKSFFFLVALVPLVTHELSAESSQDFLPLDPLLLPLNTEQKATLKTGEPVLSFQSGDVELILLPHNPLQETIQAQVNAMGANIGIEEISLVTDLPDAYRNADRDEAALTLYNLLRSVSTLEGIEYFSHSEKALKVFFVESWVIDDPQRQRPLPDLLVSNIPAWDKIFIHQKDLSFGTNQSSMTFQVEQNVFGASILNLTPMRYKGILRLIKPENMQIHLIVIPVQEGLLLYGTVVAATVNMKSLRSRAQMSFSSRIAALRSWYIQQVFKAFGDKSP